MTATSAISQWVTCFCIALLTACSGIRSELKALQDVFRTQPVIEELIRSGMLFDETGTWFTELRMNANGRTEVFVLFVSGKDISLNFGRLPEARRRGLTIVPCSPEALALAEAFNRSMASFGPLEANNAKRIVRGLLGEPYPHGIRWKHFGQKYRNR